MRIILIGPKSSGKTVTGRAFAAQVGLDFLDLDDLVAAAWAARHGEQVTIREVYRRSGGAAAFAALELAALEGVAERDWCVLSVGGSTPMQPAARRRLRENAIMVLFTARPEVLWQRTLARGGMPAYLSEESDPETAFKTRVEGFLEVVTPYADIVIDKSELSLTQAAQALGEAVADEMQLRMRSPSSFGELVRVTTFGESHGPAVGAVLDGIPPGIEFGTADIQHELDRRRPGQSRVSTARNEADRVEILSGVFEGKTTGAPIAMVIRNRDQKPSQYDDLRKVFRPGHADLAFFRKFGLRDHRGGGRSSGRETAGRVAAGALARRILQERGIEIFAFAEEIGGIKGEGVDLSSIDDNPVRAADAAAAKRMEQRIMQAKAEGDSVGGIVQVRVRGVPAGLGDPVFFKLDARLAMALMSLGAVKGVEVGSGFRAAAMAGSQHNDQMRDRRFLSNHAGGILGGISSGQEIVLRLAVKPTASIAKPQAAIDMQGRNVELAIDGRHDPCIVPRLVVVAEAMTALVLLDAFEMQKALSGQPLEPAGN